MRPSSRLAARHIAKFSSTSKMPSTVDEQQSSLASGNSDVSPIREFARRHIGPNEAQTAAMLDYLKLQVGLISR